MASRRGRKERYRVFLSYSHKDRWVARQCGKLIEQAAKGRTEVFWDEEGIAGGQRIPDKIREEIEKCDEMVALMTPHSKDSEWVTVEVAAAWEKRKLIVPIILNVDPTTILEILRPCKAFDLNNDDFETFYLPQLAQRAK